MEFTPDWLLGREFEAAPGMRVMVSSIDGAHCRVRLASGKSWAMLPMLLEDVWRQVTRGIWVPC